jgi:hypothetical protein
VIDIEGGYEQHELHPTKTYVVGMGGGSCSEANHCDKSKSHCDKAMKDCHKSKHDCCGGKSEQCCKTKCSDKPCQEQKVCSASDKPCQEQKVCSASDKPCQEQKVCSDKPCLEGKNFDVKVETIKGKKFALCCNDTISIDEYAKKTGKKLKDVSVEEVVKSYCAEKYGKDKCPMNADICGKCKENPEQCSKLKTGECKAECATNKTCETACKTECADKKECTDKKVCHTNKTCKAECDDDDDDDCCSWLYPKVKKCKHGMNIYNDFAPNEVVKPRHDVYGMVSAEFSNI